MQEKRVIMNYRLSICTLRTKGKHGYIIEVGGRPLETYVSGLSSMNLKKDVLELLPKALRAVKPYVKHEDLIAIEIQNTHLQQWLSGLVDYKDYSDELDRVFEVLESIDCRYKFIFRPEPYAKGIVLNAELSKSEFGSSIADIAKEFS